MNKNNLLVALFAAAGLAFAGGANAQGTTKDSYNMAVKNAQEAYKVDRASCNAMSGNAKDICTETAKGKEKVAKAEAEAAYKNTPKARESARVARADATYAVAKEKCDDVSGNTKDVCIKEAKAMHVKGKADAKVDRVASDSSKQAVEKTAEARREATDDKRDAEYKVAIEKCDALAGATKDTCVRDAKARYGKS